MTSCRSGSRHWTPGIPDIPKTKTNKKFIKKSVKSFWELQGRSEALKYDKLIVVDLNWFLCGYGSRILMTKNIKILQLKKIRIFLNKKLQAAFYPEASMKDVKDTGKAFSPQKRTSNTLKHKIFCGSFLPGPGST